MDPVIASSLFSVANRVYDHFSERVSQQIGSVEQKLSRFDSLMNGQMDTALPFHELMGVKSLADLDSLIASKEREMEYSPNFQKLIATVGDGNAITFARDAATGKTMLFGTLDSQAVPEEEEWTSFHKLLGELQALHTIKIDQNLFPSKPIGESVKIGLDPSSAIEKWTWNRF